jgi:hypothetical protein
MAPPNSPKPPDDILVFKYPTNVDQNLRPLFWELHKKVHALEKEVAALKAAKPPHRPDPRQGLG